MITTTPLEKAGAIFNNPVIITIEGLLDNSHSLCLATDNTREAVNWWNMYTRFSENVLFIPKYEFVVIKEWVNGKVIAEYTYVTTENDWEGNSPLWM